MKRAFVWLTLVILAMVMAAIYLSLPWVGPVSKRIAEEVVEKRASSIDVAKLTGFVWTSLSIFGPYEGREDICKSLGLMEPECSLVVPGMVAEGMDFLVFANNTTIVHQEHHNRSHGDFVLPNQIGQPLRVEANKAHFEVKRTKMTDGDYPSLILSTR